MPKNIIMFPGQGSQFQGMGKDLFQEFPQILMSANDTLGYDLGEICLENPENLLHKTNYTQPAMFLVNYLHLQKAINDGKTFDYFLGHSLGEFNALNAVGVFDFNSGLKIVQKRGELMLAIPNTGMAAIIGAEYEEIDEILKEKFPTIDIANINTPVQIVISGPLDALDTAADFLEDEGLMYIPLKVSGAFHSRYMGKIKLEFEAFIEKMDLGICSMPVISNYTAREYPEDRMGIIENITNQLDNPVKWLQSIRYLSTIENIEFHEVGPGEVLTNMLRKINTTD